MTALLSIDRMSVAFRGAAGRAAVVHDLALALQPGESLGLVGESGSGKSVTCLALLGLAGPDAEISGRAFFEGSDLLALDEAGLARVRGRRIGMIFQDPMSALNPIMTVGRQLAEALGVARPDLARAERRAAALELLREVGVDDPGRRLGQYPHELSGGLSQRIMIAMALAGRPRLLIADEPTTALDATIQAQILMLLSDLGERRGMAILLITHDLAVVAQSCRRIAVMYCGRIVESGPVEAVFAAPAHPYTRGLLAARPPGGSRQPLRPIPGSVPAPGALPPGCAFAPRCPRAAGPCRTSLPPSQGGRHRVACFRPEAPSR